MLTSHKDYEKRIVAMYYAILERDKELAQQMWDAYVKQQKQPWQAERSFVAHKTGEMIFQAEYKLVPEVKKEVNDIAELLKKLFDDPTSLSAVDKKAIERFTQKLLEDQVGKARATQIFGDAPLVTNPTLNIDGEQRVVPGFSRINREKGKEYGFSVTTQGEFIVHNPHKMIQAQTFGDFMGALQALRLEIPKPLRERYANQFTFHDMESGATATARFSDSRQDIEQIVRLMSQGADQAAVSTAAATTAANPSGSTPQPKPGDAARVVDKEEVANASATASGVNPQPGSAEIKPEPGSSAVNSDKPDADAPTPMR